jgi:hypothetical protein
VEWEENVSGFLSTQHLIFCFVQLIYD